MDVSRCPRCGHELEIISAVLNPRHIARYLRHVGMPAAPPRVSGVRMQLVLEEWFPAGQDQPGLEDN